MLDASGAVVERYRYLDYGAPRILDSTCNSRGTSAYGNPYYFTGRRWDAETGFYYFRHRYYDPTLGRFTTRDPIGIWGDALNLGNGYTYAGNNPWSYVDPWGLRGWAASCGHWLKDWGSQTVDNRETDFGRYAAGVFVYGPANFVGDCELSGVIALSRAPAGRGGWRREVAGNQ